MNEPSYNGLSFSSYQKFFETYKAILPEAQGSPAFPFVLNLDFVISLLNLLDSQKSEIDRLSRLESDRQRLQVLLIEREDTIRELRKRLS